MGEKTLQVREKIDVLLSLGWTVPLTLLYGNVAVEYICNVRCCLSSYAPQWISERIVFVWNRQPQWRFHVAALMEERWWSKRISKLIRICPIYMQRKALNGPKKATDSSYKFFRFLISIITSFFFPQVHDSDGLSLELIFHCFPPDWLHLC